MWPYCRLKCTAHRGHVFFKLTADQVLVSIGSQAHVRLTCWKPGRLVLTNVHWLWLFNHTWWKGEEDRWNYFQCCTKPNGRVAAILARFWWLCMYIEKLHHSLTVRNFVECTINKKSYNLLAQFVINRYSWFWKFSNCTRLKARAILRTFKITRTY